MKRVLAAAAISAVAVIGHGAVVGAQGPPQDVIDEQWICGPEESGGMLPPGHCINGRSQSPTFTLLVFEDGGFRQETGSVDPKADDRPCPHDPESADGTYWSPVPGLYVCHHTPSDSHEGS